MRPTNHHEYYETLSQVPIEEVVEELLADRITRRTGASIYLRCPVHKGLRGRSFVVSLTKNSFYCFKCGVAGGVLQLAEAAMCGRVTIGHKGEMPDSHRQARDFLAGKLGLPPLKAVNLNAEEQRRHTESNQLKERAQLVLIEAVKVLHARLLENSRAQEFMFNRYGYGLEVAQEYQVGYADAIGLWGQLQKAGFTETEILASGMYWRAPENGFSYLLFDGHLIFPVFKHGLPINLIGRKTGATPNKPWHKPKWKRLLIFQEGAREYVHPELGRGWLFGEDHLSDRTPENLVLVEGIPDAIAWMLNGVSAVAMITITLAEADKKRLIPKLKRCKRVVILPDTEPNPLGQQKAVDLAIWLRSFGVNAYVGRLPKPSQKIIQVMEG